MKPFSCEPRAALAVLLLAAALWDSCPAGISLLLRSSFDYPALSPAPLNTYIQRPVIAICSLKMRGYSPASPKKDKELELMNENYWT